MAKCYFFSQNTIKKLIETVLEDVNLNSTINTVTITQSISLNKLWSFRFVFNHILLKNM